MARLTEREVRAHLQLVAQQLALQDQISKRAIDEVARLYAYAAARVMATDIREEQQFLEDEFLRRVAAITETHARGVAQVAQQPLPQPRLDALERLDRALLGEPGTPLYDATDKLGRFVFGKFWDGG